MNATSVYRRILVATDFSPYSDAALKQAVWLAHQSGASLTLVHVLPNVRRLVETSSYQARVDYLYGEGTAFRQEVQQESESKLQALSNEVRAGGVAVSHKTLLGSPYAEIARTAMEESSDLVVMGTRGRSAWTQFLLGSTSQRLIRTCPSSVWVAKAEHVEPPKTILVATDFSDVSLRAVREAIGIACQSQAKLHFVHVVDATEFPEEMLTHASTAETLRREVEEDANHRFEDLITSLELGSDGVECHLMYGAPWHEVARLAREIHADLLVLGTIGRSGIRGALLGNTAERVLNVCDCSILTVKPEGFVSPVLPPIAVSH